MLRHLSRRLTLKLLGLGAALLGLPRAVRAADPSPGARFASNWHQLPDRVWLGESFWANPMEDWRIVNGAAECQTSGGNRNLHLPTRNPAPPSEPSTAA